LTGEEQQLHSQHLVSCIEWKNAYMKLMKKIKDDVLTASSDISNARAPTQAHTKKRGKITEERYTT
jgi:hypothetical protein